MLLLPGAGMVPGCSQSAEFPFGFRERRATWLEISPWPGDGNARWAGCSLLWRPQHRRLLVTGLLSFGWGEGEGQGQGLPRV